MKTLKRSLAVIMALVLVMGTTSITATAETQSTVSDETAVILSDEGITVDGSAVSTDENDAVYIADDIIYYEDLDYYEDTGYAYGEGTDEDKHSEEEAAAHTVVHITQPGTYRISGTLSLGQIFVDLGDDAKEDETAVVTLILDDVSITCTVAPAVLFYSVYECDTAWVAYDEGDTDSYSASASQDTSAAGANVIIADGSVNNITGSYVAKIYKNNGNAKKLYKFDGAFYSKMSMNISGEENESGTLNIYAEYEGLDSELHLTINSGMINIQSQDDGINTNEDEVSVTTINGGSVHILAGLGDEGDGIDSNGYLMINGGTVIALANPNADSGLDSDMGSYINGGTVLATGSTMDWPESESDQVTMNLRFEEAQDSDEAIIVTDSEGNVLFAYDPDEDETTGSYNRGYQGAVISCAEFEVGATCYVYIGGEVEGTDTNGLYDNTTITGFSGAVRQIYTGTDVGMENMPGTGNSGDSNEGDSSFPGGNSNGGILFPGGGFNSGTLFPGGDSDGGSSDDDSDLQPLSSDESEAAATLTDETVWSNQFYLTDYVNEFSGVQDEPDYNAEDDDFNNGSDDSDDGSGDTDDGSGDSDDDSGNTDDDYGDSDDNSDNTDDDYGDSDDDSGNTDDDYGDSDDDSGNTDDGSGDSDGGSDDNADGTDDAAEKTIIELYGDTRYETMAEIAEEAFESSEYAVIATGSNYPDALAAAALAGTLDAPIILVSDGKTDEALETLNELGVTTAYIVGGTDAVSEDIAAEIAMAGISVSRIAGDTRQETALAIAEVVLKTSNSDTCLIAYGANYPDALSGSAYSYRSRSPIYLTGKDGTLSDNVFAAIIEAGYENIIILGGTSVVTEETQTALESINGASVTRLAGNDRYETSAAVADWSVEQGMSYDGVAIATGTNYPDALTAAALCGQNGSVLLLTGANLQKSIPALTALRENADSIYTAYLIGGTEAISEALRTVIRYILML